MGWHIFVAKRHSWPMYHLLNILQLSLYSSRPVGFVLYVTITSTPATMYNGPICLLISLSLFTFIHV